MSHLVAFLLAVLVMAVGVIGTLLPALPGIPLIWIAMLGYGFWEGFQEISVLFLSITFAVVVISQAAEHYTKALGARRHGAGRAGAWGAVIGSFVGLFFMPVGLLLGPFIGALVAELAVGRTAEEAVKAGWGSLIGVLGSIAVNFIVALAMLFAFVLRVLL